MVFFFFVSKRSKWANATLGTGKENCEEMRKEDDGEERQTVIKEDPERRRARRKRLQDKLTVAELRGFRWGCFCVRVVLNPGDLLRCLSLSIGFSVSRLRSRFLGQRKGGRTI